MKWNEITPLTHANSNGRIGEKENQARYRPCYKLADCYVGRRTGVWLRDRASRKGRLSRRVEYCGSCTARDAPPWNRGSPRRVSGMNCVCLCNLANGFAISIVITDLHGPLTVPMLGILPISQSYSDSPLMKLLLLLHTELRSSSCGRMKWARLSRGITLTAPLWTEIPWRILKSCRTTRNWMWSWSMDVFTKLVEENIAEYSVGFCKTQTQTACLSTAWTENECIVSSLIQNIHMYPVAHQYKNIHVVIICESC